MDVTREQEAQNFRRVPESDKQWLLDFVQAVKEVDVEMKTEYERKCDELARYVLGDRLTKTSEQDVIDLSAEIQEAIEEWIGTYC